jgi:pilus assembly protein Flp/PilA
MSARKRPLLRRLIRNRRGATAIEYGLICALIAMAALVAIRGLGSEVRGPFTAASSAMTVPAS